MDNLKTIQKIMKVMKVITRIGYVMCVVGGSICLVSILVLLVLDKTGLMADEDVKAMFMFQNTVTAVAYCGCLVGLCQTAFGALITRKWNRYFTMEQNDGTPFVKESAEFLFSAAINELILGFVAFIVSLVIIAVFEVTNGEIDFPFDLKLSFDIVTVLFTMFLSLVFRYGAEVRNK